MVDIETGKLFRRYSEHQGRAWHVIELQPFLLASGADDRLVKIWDSRSKKSALTLGNHPGRVSQLLSINNTTFIAASCPDNVRESVNKAEFTIRDSRPLRSRNISIRATVISLLILRGNCFNLLRTGQKSRM